MTSYNYRRDSDHKNLLRIGARTSLCTQCGEYFASERGGDSHRVGTYDPPARACRTTSEMRDGGMWQDDRGVWHDYWREDGVPRRHPRRTVSTEPAGF